jgi:UDP-N-acetylmuramoylalanine--D-glutamate ligase
MAAYAAAKLAVLQHLPAGATLVVSADDAVAAQLLADGGHARPVPAEWALTHLLNSARDVLTSGRIKVVGFSRQTEAGARARRAEDALLYGDDHVCRIDEIQLRGEHNISNLLAAMTISGAAGATAQAMAEVARGFRGVPHRLEVVAVSNGVIWINDSIATAPERAIAALRSFDPKAQTIVLLAGGKDKNLPWQEFADEVLARVTMLVGFGDAGAMIVRTVQDRAELTRVKAPSCAVVQRLDEAVDLVRRSTAPNTVVLLSPGGTSYDAYQDFEARGEHFRALVLAAIGADDSSSQPIHRSW